MRAILLPAAMLLAAGATGPVAAAPAHDPALVCGGIDAATPLAESKWQGADGIKPQAGVFYFTGPEKSLPALDTGLHDLGFTTRPMRASSGRVANIETNIDHAWLHEMMPKLCKLATRLGIDFDGWAATMPQGQSR